MLCGGRGTAVDPQDFPAEYPVYRGQTCRYYANAKLHDTPKDAACDQDWSNMSVASKDPQEEDWRLTVQIDARVELNGS